MSRPPVPEQKSLVGYTIGKCKLLRICGRGAMGTVYKGLHSGLDIEVAVKILPPHLANNSNLVERFLREAKLAARLNHANTVRVYDVGEESGYNYLVMEFIDGTDALELVRRHGPQKAGVVADIGAGAARALEHAHANNVIHRDIKPANLMLPNGGGVKVADFGLARALASESGLTMTGAVMGTPDYMAPEQAQGESVGPLADIYSLGGTLYHLFVGRPPFQGATPMAVALQHVTNRIVVPEELVKDEPSRQLTRMIHELTQKDPKRRPSSLEEIGKRLADIARSNKHTNKLLSEGATLFATAGLKIDAEAINKAKEEAAAAAADKGRIQSPHLDKLRQAAEKARGNAGAALPDAPAPRALPAEMAELSGDMVREAKAKARRSSAELKALPRDLETPRRSSGQLPAIRDDGSPRRSSGALPPVRDEPRKSSPDMSPHRDPRPSTSRRQKPPASAPANNDMEAPGWETYAAKSFPTFERDSIMDGSASSRLNAASSGMLEIGSSAANPVADYSKPMTMPGTRVHTRKKASPLGPLVIVAVIIGAAAGGWYFFLRDKTPEPNQTQGGVIVPTLANWQGHEPNRPVTALIRGFSENVYYSGGEDGTVRMWIGGNPKPQANESVKQGTVTALAMVPDGKYVVAGTSSGEVVEMDAESLRITRYGLVKLSGVAITALLHPTLSTMLVGDSKGRLRLNNGSEPVVVSEDGGAVVAIIAHEGEYWVGAGKTLASYALQGGALVPRWKVPLDAPIQSMALSSGGVFGVIGSKLYRLGKTGASGQPLELAQPVVGTTARGAHLVVVLADGIALLNPADMQRTGLVPLPKHGAITVIEAASVAGRCLLGSEQGMLYQLAIGG